MPKYPNSRQDWLFGAPGKRRLLEHVVNAAAPDNGWTEADLARAAGLGRHGSVNPHLDALTGLGVLDVKERRYRLNKNHPLVRPLRRLVRALRELG